MYSSPYLYHNMGLGHKKQLDCMEQSCIELASEYIEFQQGIKLLHKLCTFKMMLKTLIYVMTYAANHKSILFV
jgi:hypothetical protein